MKRFTKILACLLCAVTVCVPLCLTPFSAAAAEADGSVGAVTLSSPVGEDTYTLNYEIYTDGTVGITGCSDNVIAAEIPEAIDGMPVVAITERAFFGKEQLYYVSLPDSVEYIGSQSFDDCDNLTELTLPKNLHTIEKEAFTSCDSLKAITLPKSVQWIMYGAFRGCSALASVTFEGCPYLIAEWAFENTPWWDNRPYGMYYVGEICFGCRYKKASDMPDALTVRDGTKLIAGGAFSHCETLKSVTLPESVEVIGPEAFQSCYLLEISALPEKLQWIGKYAFYFCVRLTSIELPDSVNKIEKFAFAWCEKLQNVKLPEGYCEIAGDAFWKTPWYELLPDNAAWYSGTSLAGCKGSIAGELTVQDGTEYINDDALYNQHGVTGVILPESLLYIGKNAFSDANLKGKVVIPDKMQIINAKAFLENRSLTDVTFGRDLWIINDYAFQNCQKLNELTLRDKVEYIGVGCFEGCTGLNSIRLSHALQEIDDFAFLECGLKKLIVPKSVERIGAYAVGFSGKSYSEVFTPVSGFTLYGFRDTAAEAYAEEYGVTFAALDDILGDADSDGSVNVADATLVQKYSADLAKPHNEDYIRADVNGDDAIDVTDATLIQMKAAGIIDALEY